MPRKSALLAPLHDGKAVRIRDIKSAPIGDLLDALERVAFDWASAESSPQYLKLSRKRLREEIAARALGR